MADRTIKDAAGRTWTCVSAPNGHSESTADQGKDVVLTCATPSVTTPLEITVGWRWETMSENGLGRMISQASPAPRA